MRWIRTLAVGMAGGLAAFGLDLGLAVLCVGYWLPLRPVYPLAYLVLGGALALGVQLLHLGARALGARWRRDLSGRALFALTLLLLYGLPVFERVRYALRQGGLVKTIVPVLGAGIACLGIALWAGLLGWLAAPGPGTAQRSQRWARALERGPLLAAATVALGLAVNRNLVGSLTDPRALIADAAVVGGFVLVAWWTRRAGWRAPAIAGLLILAGGVALHLLPAARTVPTNNARASHAARPVSKQPNLVLVILDTLRQDVFREVVDRTEEGRRFHEAVADAAWFDNAIAASPWTAPSVGSIHTGLYPVEHGFGHRTGPGPSGFPRMDASVVTLAQTLGNRGYRTAGLVTNALLHPDSGIGRGFQRYEILQAATHKLPILLVLVKSGWIGHELYQPADVARRHLGRWLDEPEGIEAETPFFLWVHLMDPHAPYHAHPDLAPEPGTERLPESNRLYREETRFALRELTRLLEDLDGGSGLWSRTLLVIVADHGEMFASDNHFSGVIRGGEPKVTGHGHAFYEELVRVPLVIRPPGGLGEERRIAEIVSHVDLFPTVVELLGLEVPRRLASRFRFGAWLDPRWSETPEGPLVRRGSALVSMNQHGPLHRALRTATRKLIHYPGRQRRDELYDLDEDPREQHNLAPGHPEEVAAATALQNALWARLRPAEDTPPVELDTETRRQLRALGYLH